MAVEFTHSTHKLDVRFTNLSTSTGQAKPNWDFGDGQTSEEINPTHHFDEMGRYYVTLKYILADGTAVGEFTQVVMVSDMVNTTLPDTIYLLINTYLPAENFGEIDPKIKNQFINKWQLYLGPIVNHRIPECEFTNELYFEALENQLIMELAAYDYMVLKVNQMFQGVTHQLDSHSTGESESEGENSVKHITTGPTEVEYFNGEDFLGDAISAIVKAMNPDGVIALMRNQVCMLAARLDIYLPICQRLPDQKVVPRVVNRRKKTFLGGPDPMEINNK